MLNCSCIVTASQIVMASAQVLFQRFYCKKSFAHHDLQEVAIACLFLAAKIEEHPKRLRDFINVTYRVVQRNGGATGMLLPLNQYGDEFLILKRNVIRAERRVLKELGFCVHLKHPHKWIISYIGVLGLDECDGLAQCAWNYMNDGLRTDVFLRYPMETIAAACLHLALIHLQIPMPPQWYTGFDAEPEHVARIWCASSKGSEKTAFLPALWATACLMLIALYRPTL
eukprot:m.108189 g.108189  ORF g.108189 m.108189 type:complete len:227 (+) comp9249_c0_seq1:223-903(+)